MSEPKSPNVALSAAVAVPRPGPSRSVPVSVAVSESVPLKVGNLDDGPTHAQATHKGAPSAPPRESTQMFENAKGAPLDEAPLFDTSQPDESERALGVLESALNRDARPRFEVELESETAEDAFAAGLADEGARLEGTGARALIEANQQILASLGDTVEDLREAGRSFCVVAQALADASGVSVVEIIELWTDLAGYVNAFSLVQEPKGMFLTLRSVIALIGSARALRDSVTPLTGVSVEALSAAFMDRLRGADSEALSRSAAAEAKRSHHTKPSPSVPPPKAAPPKAAPVKPQPSPSQNALRQAEAQASREKAKREADAKKAQEKALKGLDAEKAQVEKLAIAEPLKAPLLKDIEKRRQAVLKGQVPK